MKKKFAILLAVLMTVAVLTPFGATNLMAAAPGHATAVSFLDIGDTTRRTTIAAPFGTNNVFADRTLAIPAGTAHNRQGIWYGAAGTANLQFGTAIAGQAADMR
ncbi:MAG: hypothetical protein FWC95_07760, partial [Defluviitaleaceae bacterium]|nr:hypothetical protein [Defluviitaleaceae bacterium]